MSQASSVLPTSSAFTANLTNASLPNATALNGAEWLGLLCDWTSDVSLCMGTVIPTLGFGVFITVIVLLFCLKSRIADEYIPLAEWSDSVLVPPSVSLMSESRKDWVYQKIRNMPLHKLFRRLRLDDQYTEHCATVGATTLGDLLHLKPVCLRDLGFGIAEKKLVIRAIEKRVEYTEELKRVGARTINLPSVVPTFTEEADATNSGDCRFKALFPNLSVMQLHIRNAVIGPANRDSVGPGGSPEITSHEVSRMFWAFLIGEIEKAGDCAKNGPLLSLSVGNCRPVRVAKVFYDNVHARWLNAQQTPVKVSVALATTFKRVRIVHKPALLDVNEQFWLSFVQRWSSDRVRIQRLASLANAKKEARRRLKRMEQEEKLGIMQLSSLSILADNVFGDPLEEQELELKDYDPSLFDDELDDEWEIPEDLRDSETAEFDVRLIKVSPPLSHIQSLLPEELQNNDDDISREVVYTTSVKLFNCFVHEFQAGELGLSMDAAQLSRAGGAEVEMESLSKAYAPPVALRKVRMLIRVEEVKDTSERFDDVRRHLVPVEQRVALSTSKRYGSPKVVFSSPLSNAPNGVTHEPPKQKLEYESSEAPAAVSLEDREDQSTPIRHINDEEL